MNASTYKTPGEPAAEQSPWPPASAKTAKNAAPGRDALEALLAFAALQQQLRNRGAQEGAEPSSPSRFNQDRFALDEVLQLVAERALAITKADGVAIALAENGAVLCRAVAGTITPDKGATVNPNYGFSGACLSSGSVVRCDDAQTDPRVNPDICRKLGSLSMVAVPLWAKQTVIGLIEAFAKDARHFKDTDVRSLNLLAELVLAALQPEEEDRMAEISRRVVRRGGAVEPIRRLPTKPPDSIAAPVPSMKPAAAIPARVETRGKIEVLAREAPPEILPAPAEVQDSRRGLWIGLAVMAALLVSAGTWWGVRSRNGAHPSNAAATIPANVSTSKPAPLLETPVPASLPVTPRDPSELLAITGIRHWSSPDSSTVVIDLQDQVQYEAHRLNDPERIYFDLHDTKLDAKLNRYIEIGDPLLLRVRAAELSPGTTRVVLETTTSVNFTVSLEQNPYRLVVEVRSPDARPQARAKVDLFGPANPPITAQEAAVSAAAENHPAKIVAAMPKLRIVLDAGHGGWDLGTVGRQGLLEKDLVLDIVGRLGKLVETKLGAEVVYTRSDDVYVPLEKRTEVANLSKADLFLSVHANYSDFPSARGVETYYTNTYSSVHARTPDASGGKAPLDVSWTNVNIREKVDDSKRFATDIQQSLYHAVAAKSEVPNRGVKEASYVVLTGATMPAVLTEVSFVSSPTDETNLQSSTYRQQLAEALYQGIAKYEASLHRTTASLTRPSGN